MENNATDMLLLLQRAMEMMGKDADPEALKRFLNSTDHMDALPDTYYQPEAQQFCRFEFKEAYKWWHYRLTLSVAATGVLTNLFNLATLTRPYMATPTNLLLLGLAVADLLVVTEYIPYAASTLLGGEQLVEAREHAFYIITHAHLSQVCHTIAIWLTVSLAVWRWVVVCRPHAAVTLCTTPRARRLLLAVYLACPLVTIPTFFLYTVEEITVADADEDSSNAYIVNLSSNKLLKEITLLVHSVVVKLVPCLLITLLIPAIVRGMWLAKRRRQRLLRRGHGRTPTAVTVAAAAAAVPATCPNALLTGVMKPAEQSNVRLPNGTTTTAGAVAKPANDTLQHHRRDALASFYMRATKLVFSSSSPSQRETGATERSTSMLLLMMLLFLLAEAPNGLLTGMALFYGHKFFIDCYIQLGDLMDLLALTNSSINFFLYCVMCKQFRDTFVGLFCSCCSRRRPAKKPLQTETSLPPSKTSMI
ncbi:G-protein coupled receptor dmsr-1-like [Eriocheir sinensis]|uniref:G-protein coupled receptor dmsr-1-like n=1 Tax=Eriocheir sinensis TaxID=95602 RepID=UPI0021C6104B|nr:G-protein coupled receptor dmsr-1-like [Eriocheir sinensis]